MAKWRGWLMGLMGLTLVGTLPAGCENEGEDSDVDVTGTWSGTIENTTSDETSDATLDLVQDGTNVTGTTGTGWGASSVTGAVSGSSVSLTISGETATEVDADVAGDSMTATWSNDDGASGTAELERE